VKRRNIKKDEYTTVIAIFDRKSWGTLGNSWVTVGWQLGNSSHRISHRINLHNKRSHVLGQSSQSFRSVELTEGKNLPMGQDLQVCHSPAR
jgi:hypothetical protein